MYQSALASHKIPKRAHRHNRSILTRALALAVTVLFMSGSIPAAIAAGTWSPTSGMSVARDRPTATVLTNNKVLVVGGYSGSAFLSSAELYDPTNNNWTPTGSMSTARTSHTATLLSNGKVLATGGYNGSVLVSAQPYDPVNGTWGATSNMYYSARMRHTATLLANGKVLVAGGYSGSAYLSSAELYDPTSNSWAPTGSMSTARASHTATLLSNGKVLVAGGINRGLNSSGSLKTAELYDPITGRWSQTGQMAVTRFFHSATLLLDGKVLVAGGDPSGSASFAPNFDTLPSAELYSPATGTWSPTTGRMTKTRFFHSAVRLADGKVLVAGGYYYGSPIFSAELYDPGTGTWNDAGVMTVRRHFHIATLLFNNKVLVAGGCQDYCDAYLSTAELYTP